MSTLPTDRTTANTEEEHVDDHNELHRLHNDYDGTLPADFARVGLNLSDLDDVSVAKTNLKVGYAARLFARAHYR